jgi:uncharacterized protein
MPAVDEAHTCRILAIDGGGIRGVIPATILTKLEEALGGGPLGRHFHMLAGTSTGGILAAGLALETPAAKLQDFYLKDGPGIFSTNFYSTVEGPKYAAAPLETALKTEFGDAQLSDLMHDLICPAYDLEARKGILFKSWKARGVEEPTPAASDFLLRAVTRATSAAPVYFAPAQAVAADGKTYALIDGGMFGNNPAAIALVAARRLMPLATRFLIVSLGTGENLMPIKYADAASWGIVGWGAKIIDIIFDAMGSTVEYELNQIDGVSQLRWQSSLMGANDALDDASAGNMKNLQACATRTLGKQKVAVDGLIAELQRTSLPDRILLGYPIALGTTRPEKIQDFAIPAIKTEAMTAMGVLSPIVATPWKVGGAVAGALAGTPLGPIGMIGGAVLGYLGAGLVKHS